MALTVDDFKVGDKVRWMDAREQGRSVRFSERKGEVLEVGTRTLTIQLRDSAGIRRGKVIKYPARVEKVTPGPGPLSRALFPERTGQ